MQTNTLTAIDKLNNVNIASQKILMTPKQLKEELPMPHKSVEFVSNARQQIADILTGKDNRKLAIVGPCSIHDIKSAKEYAFKLKNLHDKLSDQLYIVMRVYFEKPRTTIGWKGLINDPHLNNSFDVEQGLLIARELLLWLAKLEIPVATEMLDPISPQYLSELISWTAIGARTSESQTHREMASGLSMPIGFKYGTTGSASDAINAMKAASSAHSFMGINGQGQVTLLNTTGNPFGHVILRGGDKPNYHAQDIALYKQKLNQAQLTTNLMVDCSHGNSLKDHNKQVLVLENIVDQILAGNQSIIGFMLESHLHEGNQKLLNDDAALRYGVSITDACINWATTQDCLQLTAQRLKDNDCHTTAIRNGITF
jgi:3-deoxy-7-phosphoheptulonate synthase